jgi:hypothetical protein
MNELNFGTVKKLVMGYWLYTAAMCCYMGVRLHPVRLELCVAICHGVRRLQAAQQRARIAIFLHNCQELQTFSVYRELSVLSFGSVLCSYQGCWHDMSDRSIPPCRWQLLAHILARDRRPRHPVLACCACGLYRICTVTNSHRGFKAGFNSCFNLHLSAALSAGNRSWNQHRSFRRFLPDPSSQALPLRKAASRAETATDTWQHV